MIKAFVLSFVTINYELCATSSCELQEFSLTTKENKSELFPESMIDDSSCWAFNFPIRVLMVESNRPEKRRMTVNNCRSAGDWFNKL